MEASTAVAFSEPRKPAQWQRPHILRRSTRLPMEYSFESNGRCNVRVAATIEERKRIWTMVYQVYARSGYAKPDEGGLWYSKYDAIPNAYPLMVERDKELLASLTVLPDSEIGLAADILYKREIDALRQAGRHPCEIISMASKEKNLRHGAEIVKHIFKLGYLVASRILQCTDFLITVNPRHARFYERTLLMERLGKVREYGKVGGAPAVLMRLDLKTAEDRYRTRYGDRDGSFYRFFVDQETEPGWIALLKSQHRALDKQALERYFSESHIDLQKLRDSTPEAICQ